MKTPPSKDFPDDSKSYWVEDVSIEPAATLVWNRLSADLRRRLTNAILQREVRSMGADLYSAQVDGVLAIFQRKPGRMNGIILSVLTPSEQAILW